MHLRPYVLLALFAAACQGEPQPAPVAAPVEVRAPAPAAETLFDGATLANWDGDPRFWRVENGCIVGESTTANPCNATTYLLWRGGALEDFELELDFRLTGGNSGVQFRSEDRGGWQVAGFQADLEGGPSWTGCLYEQDGAGVVATRGEEVLLDGNGARKERFGDGAKLLELVKPREWNRYRIVARGERVELSINGTLFTSVVDLRPERRLAGLLALQLHQGPPMKAEYRNFELRRLPKSDARAVVAPAPKPAVASDGAHRISPNFQGTKPNWIWSSADSPDWDTIVLARNFQLATPPVRTLLRGSADNHVRVFLNGQLALTNDDWAQALEVDVSKLVKDGDNELIALAWNEGGIAAAWFELVAERDGARPLRVLSDGSWTAQRLSIHTDRATWTPESLDRGRFSPAHVVGQFGMAPWGLLTFGSPTVVADERALPAEDLVLLPGFRAELLYSVPKAQEGSWVSLCEDPAGRFYTSDQYGGLFRITVGATAADTKVEPVPIEIGSAHGLCWAFDSLYAVVSESSGRDNGLYRVRDTNGDDVLDSVQLLRKFEGGGEHGPHAVVLSPDGTGLWIVGGNHTPLPEPIDHYSRPKNWAEDLLEPRIEDPNGHAVGIRAPAGWVVRTDADAKQWDLWACGFRNAYDIAFDNEGELFTFDSDMEWDMGAPWYRPTRIFHVVRGADFGWRGGPGKMPPTYPDTWPSVVDIGASSPTGITFGYGAKFPPRYQRALFALDWAYGKVYAVHLEPSGSTYTGSFEEFVSGRPFPVTDVVIARDGAMYVTTGGRRTQSGLYRITSIGGSEVDARKEAEMSSAQRTTRPARELRRSLETLLGSQQAASEDVFAALDSADRFTAEAARVALEQRPLEQWSLFRPTTPTGRVQFCVALAHFGGTEARPLLLERLAQLDFAQSDELQRIAVVRTNHLATLRLGLTGADAASIAQRFEPHYPSGSAAVDRELLQLLVSLGSPRALVPALDVLESNAAQEERIWAAYCLRVAGAGWTPELRLRQFRGLASLLAVAKGGHSLRKYIEEIRRQSAEFLDDETHELVAPFLEAPKPVAASAPAVEPMKFVRTWTREELGTFVREPLVARNFERGRELFTRARCAECHRMAGEGGGTGPDLTGAGSRFSRSDWLDNLLEPSKVISDQYQDTEVLTTDGELYVGRIERDDSSGITLRRLPPQEDTIDLAREQIERRRLYPYSRMPAGLLDVLSEDDVRDLAAYVLSGANPASPEFSKP